MSDPLAVELGRRGGLKGGHARAEKLSPEARSAISSHAARKRWGHASVYAPEGSVSWAEKARGALELIAYRDKAAPGHELISWLQTVIVIHEGKRK